MAEWKEEVNRPRVPTNLAIYREALYAIGMLYWQGEGVEQDYTIAAVWLKQAADINHPGAQNKLGYLYSAGQGVPQNYQQARHWFEMAAVQGDPDAKHNLDLMFQRGLFAEAKGAADEAQTDQQTESTLVSAPDPEVVPPPRTVMQRKPELETVSPPRAAAEPERGAEAAPPPVPAIQPKPDPQPEMREQAAAADAPPPAGTPESGPDPDEVWILAQNPEHYTIQVIALRSVDNLRAFIASNPRWEPFAIYTPAGNQRPLSVLVQGVYPDLASARAAAARFPPGLQAREALWIRRFGMVQDMIQ